MTGDLRRALRMLRIALIKAVVESARIAGQCAVFRYGPVFFAAVAVAPFVGLLVPDGRAIAGSDYSAAYRPFQTFVRSELLAGRFPFWLPYCSCGTALHAGQNATLCYAPAAIAVACFGANAGIKLNLFLHLLLCTAGQYALARRLSITRAGAAFAALLAVWGAFAMDHLAAGHITFVVGYALTPWFLLALIRLLAAPGPGSAASLALVVAAFELGSHPQLLYDALLAATCWLVGWFISARARGLRARGIGWLAIAAIVAIFLSAAQWVPAAELAHDGLSEAERGSREHAAMYAADGSDLARFFMPRFKGDELLGVKPLERGGYDHERGAYLGILTIPLALFGLSRAGAAGWQWAAAWLCLVAAEIALADHSPFWRLFADFVPGLVWFRCQGRIFSVVDIIVPLLAARGLDGLVSRAPRGGRWRLALLAGFFCAASAAFGDALGRWMAHVGWQAYLSYASTYLRQEYIDWMGMVGLVAFVLFLGALFGREFPRVAYCLAILTVGADLYEYNVRHFRLVPPPGASQIRFPKGVEPTRFVFTPSGNNYTRIALQYSWAVPLAIRSRVSSASTNDGGVLPAAVSRLYDAIERGPRAALALAACDWAYDESTGQWRALPDALPRFRLLRADAEALCERAIGECDEHDVLALRKAQTGRIIVQHEEPRRLEFVVEAPEDAIFVLADTYYPGWRCAVDGRGVPIKAAHGVFRAVPVPKGRHEVRFSYEPLSFQIGLGMSLLGVASLVVLIYLAARRARSVAPRGARIERRLAVVSNTEPSTFHPT